MLIVVGALPSGAASGAEYGTAAEARPMLNQQACRVAFQARWLTYSPTISPFWTEKCPASYGL